MDKKFDSLKIIKDAETYAYRIYLNETELHNVKSYELKDDADVPCPVVKLELNLGGSIEVEI